MLLPPFPLPPHFFPVEVAHSLTRAERQRRITPAEGARAFLHISQSLPTLFPSLPLRVRAYAISSQERIGVYDCVYVALAGAARDAPSSPPTTGE